MTRLNTDLALAKYEMANAKSQIKQAESNIIKDQYEIAKKIVESRKEELTLLYELSEMRIKKHEITQKYNHLISKEKLNPKEKYDNYKNLDIPSRNIVRDYERIIKEYNRLEERVAKVKTEITTFEENKNKKNKSQDYWQNKVIQDNTKKYKDAQMRYDNFIEKEKIRHKKNSYGGSLKSPSREEYAQEIISYDYETRDDGTLITKQKVGYEMRSRIKNERENAKQEDCIVM